MDKGSGGSGTAGGGTTDAVPAWQLFALAGLLGATFLTFMARGQSAPAILLLSLTVFAAAAVGIAALRTLTPLAGGQVDAGRPLGRVLGGRSRAALEREKALTLRAIKELEFDRAMGKVSDADFLDMAGRLRARAAGLIQRLDAGRSYRQQIEEELAKRIGPAAGAHTAATVATGPPAVERCAGCGTANEPDARFCKQCGASLSRTPSPSS
jgi:hypothetical protein